MRHLQQGQQPLLRLPHLPGGAPAQGPPASQVRALAACLGLFIVVRALAAV